MNACRKKVPDHFHIGMRLSPESSGIQSGIDIDETIQVEKWLKEGN
ncbi:hypothetical protein [Fluviispira multicolorata]